MTVYMWHGRAGGHFGSELNWRAHWHLAVMWVQVMCSHVLFNAILSHCIPLVSALLADPFAAVSCWHWLYVTSRKAGAISIATVGSMVSIAYHVRHHVSGPSHSPLEPIWAAIATVGAFLFWRSTSAGALRCTPVPALWR